MYPTWQHTMNAEKLRSSVCVCVWGIVKLMEYWNLYLVCETRKEAKFVRYAHTQTQNNIERSSIYSHDIRVPWKQTDWRCMSINPSISAQNDDDIHVLFYNFCAPQFLIFHKYIRIHYISTLILWREIILCIVKKISSKLFFVILVFHFRYTCKMSSGCDCCL